MSKNEPKTGFEPADHVTVGFLVWCYRCDGHGWVKKGEDRSPMAQMYGGWAPGPPIICPMCKGTRKVAVAAE